MCSDTYQAIRMLQTLPVYLRIAGSSRHTRQQAIKANPRPVQPLECPRTWQKVRRTHVCTQIMHREGRCPSTSSKLRPGLAILERFLGDMCKGHKPPIRQRIHPHVAREFPRCWALRSARRHYLVIWGECRQVSQHCGSFPWFYTKCPTLRKQPLRTWIYNALVRGEFAIIPVAVFSACLT